MVSQMQIARILAADIGSTSTHVCLVDQIEGSYRLVARGDVLSTVNDVDQGVMSGLVQAIRQIERVVQYPLLDINNEFIFSEPQDRTLPVTFCATSSAAPPLRVLILGLSNTFSIPSARRACLLPVVELAGAFELFLTQSYDPGYWANLYKLHPEVIVLVGGFDIALTKPFEACAHFLVKLYENTDRDQRPVVILAGNQAEVIELGQSLSTSFYVRSVPNIRSDPDTEYLDELRHELVRMYEQTKLSQLKGYSRLLKWCAIPPQAACSALEHLYRFLASEAYPEQFTMGIDAGASHTLLFSQAGTDAPIVCGTHEGIKNYNSVNGDAIRRWLPLSVTDKDAMRGSLRKFVQPTQSPSETPASLASFSVAHETILGSVRSWQDIPGSNDPTVNGSIDRLYAHGGVFVHTPDKALGLLTLLDTLQPTGITQVVLDWAEIWPQLGAVAAVMPQAAIEVLEQDGLSMSGTIIAPTGKAEYQGQALYLTITHADGSSENYAVPAGIIKRVVSSIDEVVTIKARAGLHWDLGYRRRRSIEAVVRCGALGIIVDTRGRPLNYTKAGLLWRTRVETDIQTLTSAIRLMYPQSTLIRGKQT
jgi:hypothetical protein